MSEFISITGARENNLADVSLGSAITTGTLVTLGLLLLALHLAGVGTGSRSWSWRRARR